MNLTFITSNQNKAALLSEYLGHPVTHQALDLSEIQSLDLEEIACCKAQEAFRLVGQPVLVEDMSLTFNALGELPGPFIKWFLKSLGNPGLCKILDSYEDRSAVATVIFCLNDGEEQHFFTGTVTGHIAQEPRGDQGFGWDSIFIADGETKTWGEMDKEEQFKASMRPEAFEKLRTFLAKN